MRRIPNFKPGADIGPTILRVCYAESGTNEGYPRCRSSSSGSETGTCSTTSTTGAALTWSPSRLGWYCCRPKMGSGSIPTERRRYAGAHALGMPVRVGQYACPRYARTASCSTKRRSGGSYAESGSMSRECGERREEGGQGRGRMEPWWGKAERGGEGGCESERGEEGESKAREEREDSRERNETSSAHTPLPCLVSTDRTHTRL